MSVFHIGCKYDINVSYVIINQVIFLDRIRGEGVYQLVKITTFVLDNLMLMAYKKVTENKQ